MPMARAGNQIPLGDKLYFFTSPTPATTKCLIFAHGGLLRGDGKYALPAGTTIHYYVSHGKARKTNPTLAILAENTGEQLLDLCVTGPANIENYRLRKAVGSGWSGEAFSYHDVQRTMNQNQGYAAHANGNWCPHVVSVRRRFKMMGKTILLGEIIDAVQQHNPNIVDFYYGGCRVDHSASAVKSAFMRAAVEVLR
jgi:hypothetical protein